MPSLSALQAGLASRDVNGSSQQKKLQPAPDLKIEIFLVWLVGCPPDAALPQERDTPTKQ